MNFGLSEEQKFSKQHSISFLEDNSILIYDNGAKNQKSRVIIIGINEENKKVEKFIEYDLGVFSIATGSVQAIDEQNGVFLLSYGNGNYNNKRNIEEKNLETGETYFSFDFWAGTQIYSVLKIK